MVKNVLILFLFILLTACSNLEKKFIGEHEKNILIVKLENFKKDLKNGSIQNYDDFFSNNLRAQKAFEELRDIDFTNINIIYSPPQFKEDEAINVIGFSSDTYTLYVEATYKFTNNKWTVINITEKRR